MDTYWLSSGLNVTHVLSICAFNILTRLKSTRLQRRPLVNIRQNLPSMLFLSLNGVQNWPAMCISLVSCCYAITQTLNNQSIY